MLLSFLFLCQLWHCATYTVCWLLSLCRFFSLFTVDKPVDCFFDYALPCPHCGMSLLLLLSCCTATAITNKSTATPPESQLILAFLLAFVPLSSMLPFPRPFDCYCIFWTTPHQCGAISLLLLSCFTAKAAPQQPHCTLQTASWFSPFCQLPPLSPPLPLPPLPATWIAATAVKDVAATLLQCCRYLCPLPLFCGLRYCAISSLPHPMSTVIAANISLWHCRWLGPWFIVVLPPLSM